MTHMHPLLVAIYDTTSDRDRERLAALMSRNGSTLFVESVHTAAACSGNGVTYHWVTVVYWKSVV